MASQPRKLFWLIVRLLVFIAGVAYIAANLHWSDHVLAIIDSSGIPRLMQLARPAGDDDASFDVLDDKNVVVEVAHSQVVNEPDKRNMTVIVDGQPRHLLGLDLANDPPQPRRFLVEEGGNGVWVDPSQVLQGDQRGAYHVTVPHPRVQIGVPHMVREAQPSLLWSAILVFPLTFVITALRWHELLRALDVRITLARTFALNMVGAFYNTAMPGSTGGDVLKAYYIARQTHHRTRAVMSVLVDRVIGLLALVVLGGTMAALNWTVPECREVALASAAILLATAAGLLVFFNPTLHRLFFLDAILKRLPMQATIQTAIESLRIFGRRPLLVLGALVVSLPVHGVVVLSAMFAGMAFHLPIPLFYYWTVVPVVVLSGAIPISPQGAGVMEYFAITLLQPRGATNGQAIALTMSIRLVQVLWNLAGGFYVLKGGFHVPNIVEQKQAEAEDQDQPPAGDAPPQPPGPIAPRPI
jgi:uncharacterized protein (TIRG00374 family)